MTAEMESGATVHQIKPHLRTIKSFSNKLQVLTWPQARMNRFKLRHSTSFFLYGDSSLTSYSQISFDQFLLNKVTLSILASAVI